jgi:hypothetical protein
VLYANPFMLFVFIPKGRLYPCKCNQIKKEQNLLIKTLEQFR